MQSDAATVEAYLDGLPGERREVVSAVRTAVLERLQPGFEEGMQYGMSGYYVPLERYARTTNGQPLSLAGLASQKRHVSLYLMAVYGDEEEGARFRAEWEATGRRLDMGKSCVRFRRLEEVPLDVVGDAVGRTSVDELIGLYERSRAGREGRRKNPA
jgi:hypothetical protein